MSDCVIIRDGGFGFDGMLVWQEYVAGTDPADLDSALAITYIRPEDGGVRIDWRGGTSAAHYLESSMELDVSSEWSVLSTSAPDTPVDNSYLDNEVLGSVRFYRIRAVRENQ